MESVFRLTVWLQRPKHFQFWGQQSVYFAPSLHWCSVLRVFKSTSSYTERKEVKRTRIWGHTWGSNVGLFCNYGCALNNCANSSSNWTINLTPPRVLLRKQLLDQDLLYTVLITMLYKYILYYRCCLNHPFKIIQQLNHPLLPQTMCVSVVTVIWTCYSNTN